MLEEGLEVCSDVPHGLHRFAEFVRAAAESLGPAAKVFGIVLVDAWIPRDPGCLVVVRHGGRGLSTPKPTTMRPTTAGRAGLPQTRRRRGDLRASAQPLNGAFVRPPDGASV